MNIAAILGFVTGNWQRLVIYGLLILGALGTAAGWGYMKGAQKLSDYKATQAIEGAKIIVKQGKVTERVITKYIKVKGETQIITNTIEKEVIKYVDAKLDQYPLSTAFVGLHDSSVFNTLPDPARSTDGTASGIKASEALPVIQSNYKTCNETTDRLRALQEWVRGQAALNAPG